MPCLSYLVAHARRSKDDNLVKIPLQSLLNYLQMQEPEEATAEAVAQRKGIIFFVDEGGIVKLELLHALLEFLVIV